MKKDNEIVGFIDIHCHIIPHVDDGAKTTAQALHIVDIAYENGIRAMIATPHYEVGRYEKSSEDIRQYYDKLNAEVHKKYPDFSIYLGREIFFSDGVPELLEKGELQSLADSRYALIEFSPNDSFKYIKENLYRVTIAGYTPIVAHAERYEELMEDVDNIEEIVEAGAYIQINAGTIAGNSGRRMRKQILNLIKEGLVHFIGTDSHSDGHRSPVLDECIKYLKKKTDEETIRRIMIDNPEKILQNILLD